jgi:hypothetical protein
MPLTQTYAQATKLTHDAPKLPSYPIPAVFPPSTALFKEVGILLLFFYASVF